MTETNGELVKTEQANAVLWLTLNRPDKLNALNAALKDAISRELRRGIEDESVRVLVFTGAGRAFAAGADIREFQQVENAHQAHDWTGEAMDVWNQVAASPKPTIAAVNGFALGGGCELAMACDLRIAAEEAQFGQPEINLGIMPGAGGTQRLPRFVGAARAKELLFTGDPIDAAEAERIGLVNRVVPADQLLAQTRELAERLAEQAPVALEMIKRAVDEGLETDLDTGLGIERKLFSLLFSTQDRLEGVDAFLNQRDPQFKGE